MRTALGLFVVGLGERLADVGARIARVKRFHSRVWQ